MADLVRWHVEPRVLVAQRCAVSRDAFLKLYRLNAHGFTEIRLEADSQERDVISEPSFVDNLVKVGHRP